MHRYFILVALIAGLLSTNALAQSAALCKDGGTGKPEICVRFDNHGTQPVENTDVDFDVSTDPDNPSVTLRHGSYQWRVWCWDDDSNQEPQNIGTITNFNQNWDYDIKILQPDGDPGAADLKHLDLGEAEIGSTHWSKVESGEITGDLPANATFKLHRYDSSGGYANFTIGGFVRQGVEIVLGQGQGFTVEKQVLGSAPNYVTVLIEEDISGGNFAVAELTHDFVMTVLGSVTNGAIQLGDPDEVFLTIGTMGANSDIILAAVEDDDVSTIGTITIKSDLPASASIYAPDVNLAGGITFEATGPVRKDILGDITLHNMAGSILADDLDGTIEIARSFHGLGGSSGSLDLTGDMSGALLVNTEEGNFSMDVDVTIDGDFTSGAQIVVHKGSNGEFDQAGSIDVGGELAGTVSIGGDFAPGDDDGAAELSVGTDLSGTVFVGGDFAGDVTIGDDFTSGADFTVGTEVTPKDMVDGATFTVASNSRGDFWVTGDVEDGAVLTLNKLGANGDILVDGDFHGDISITEETNATSLIQLMGGLMSGALIVINAGEDDVSDANGAIFIGNPNVFCTGGGTCFLDDVEYDGVINILNGTSGGGDFTGVITVQGCHDDEDPMQLCICGTDSGTKNIEQTDCENEVPGFACSSNPCN